MSRVEKWFGDAVMVLAAPFVLWAAVVVAAHVWAIRLFWELTEPSCPTHNPGPAQPGSGAGRA